MKEKERRSIIPEIIFQSLPKRMKDHQLKYKNAYCFLKNAGIPVLMITYEELVGHFNETMTKVGEFVGEEVTGEGFGGFVSKHRPLRNRIGNYKEVEKYLKEYFPQYVCLLKEDCEFPVGFDCAGRDDPFFFPGKKKV